MPFTGRFQPPALFFRLNLCLLNPQVQSNKSRNLWGNPNNIIGLIVETDIAARTTGQISINHTSANLYYFVFFFPY